MPFECVPNPRHGTPGLVTLTAAGFRRTRAAITAVPGYAPTPLRALPDVAAEAGVLTVHLKDESARFGLGGMEGLGGAHAARGALLAALARHPGLRASDITLCCASDGGHARSLAWGARRLGAACAVFVGADSEPGRLAVLRALGAAVHQVAGPPDEAAARAAAETPGWLLVSDISRPGYTEIPREIMQGYRLMPDEALDQMPGPPTHAFIQSGRDGGAMAASVSIGMRARLLPSPVLAVVEPEGADALGRGARAGAMSRPETPSGPGAPGLLAPGLLAPGLLAWQELDRAADAFLSVPAPHAAAASRRLSGLGISSGPLGAIGLAALLLAAADPAARAVLRLTRDSHVLLFSTEAGPESVSKSVPESVSLPEPPPA